MSEPTVKVTRYTALYRRSVNGAWLRNGGETEAFEIPESRAFGYVVYASASVSVTLEWPDGHTEHYGSGTGLEVYGPAHSRLLPESDRGSGAWYPAGRRILRQRPGRGDYQHGRVMHRADGSISHVEWEQ